MRTPCRPQLVGLACGIQVVSRQVQVAGLQMGLAYLELEVGDADAVAVPRPAGQGIEEIDQRHVHLP